MSPEAIGEDMRGGVRCRRAVSIVGPAGVRLRDYLLAICGERRERRRSFRSNLARPIRSQSPPGVDDDGSDLSLSLSIPLLPSLSQAPLSFLLLLPACVPFLA